jgi:hypothetical protein
LSFLDASGVRPLGGFLFIAAVAVGGAFALRACTVARLPLRSSGRVEALAILPGDAMMLEHRMADLLALPEVAARLAKEPGPILVYLVPRDYIMQGMIADTDPRWRLYEHHHALAMIADWIFHPFRHLQGGHQMMHHDLGDQPAVGSPQAGAVRRLIFLRLEGVGAAATPGSCFAINARRIPLFFVDVDVHGLALLGVKGLGRGTGWGGVPTPMF